MAIVRSAALQVALIGLGAGDDDAGLGQHLLRRRHLAHLGPDPLDVGPAALGAVDVGQHGQQLDGRVQRLRRLELGRRLLPASRCGRPSGPSTSCTAATFGSSRSS